MKGCLFYMENEEKKEVIVKEVIKEVPKKDKRSITIKLPNPIKLVIYAIIVCAVLGLSIFGITNGFKTQEKVLKLGLEDVGELVTQTCHTVVLEDTTNNRKIANLLDIPFTESRQIFSYDFDVDAAIDFSKIDPNGIDDDKKEIRIKLPHAKIFKTVLLPNTFKSYLDSESLFSRINLTQHNDALISMENKAQNQCLASNFLERADANAQTLLSAMIKSEKKYKDYKIIYEYIDEITKNVDDVKEGETNEKEKK